MKSTTRFTLAAILTGALIGAPALGATAHTAPAESATVAAPAASKTKTKISIKKAGAKKLLGKLTPSKHTKGKKVTVYFKAAGKSQYKALKKVTVSSAGVWRYTKTLKPGRYYAKFAGSASLKSVKSKVVKVAKKKTESAPAPAPTPAPDVYYENCDAVRNAGKAPIYAGQPGYRAGLDRDGDGVGCE